MQSENPISQVMEKDMELVKKYMDDAKDARRVVYLLATLTLRGWYVPADPKDKELMNSIIELAKKENS